VQFGAEHVPVSRAGGCDRYAVSEYIHHGGRSRIDGCGRARMNIYTPRDSTADHTLERELGVPLIVRVGRTVRMTEEGGRILDRARELARNFRRPAQHRNDTPLPGRLRLGACTTALVGLLPRSSHGWSALPQHHVYIRPVIPLSCIRPWRAATRMRHLFCKRRMSCRKPAIAVVAREPLIVLAPKHLADREPTTCWP